jgi:hypothetical protein
VGSQWGDADDKVKTEVIERIKGVLTHDEDMFDALLAAAPRHVSRAVHNQSALAGVREGVLRRASVDNKELLDLLSGVIYLRVGARCYDDEIRRMTVVLRTEMHGMQILSQRDEALKAVREHCPVIDSKHYRITENHVENSAQQGACGFWIDPLVVIEHYMSFGTFRAGLEGEEAGIVVCVDASPILAGGEGITVMLLHFYNCHCLWQNPHHEFLVAAWSGDDSEESMVVHCFIAASPGFAG